MRILQLHNRYLLRGGEDVAFECEVALLRAAGYEVETLVFENTALLRMPRGRQLAALFYNSAAVAALRKQVEAFEPAVIHVHNFGYYASPAILVAAQQMGVPVVVTLHNYRLICIGSSLYRAGSTCQLCTKRRWPLAGVRYGCFQGSRWRSLLLQLATSYHHWRGTFRAVDHYIVPKRFSKELFLGSTLGVSSARITVKYNSVADALQTARPQAPREDFFLYVGRLSEQKGVDLLLKIASRTAARMEFIGEGPLAGAVAHAAATAPERLCYCGKKDAAFVSDRLRRCCGLLVPSRWHETGPYVVLEAFATATPVVCHQLEALSEIVHHEKNGLLCALDDLTGWEAAIERLATDKSLHVRLSAGARRSYESHFSHARNTEALLAIYEKVCADHRTKLA